MDAGESVLSMQASPSVAASCLADPHSACTCTLFACFVCPLLPLASRIAGPPSIRLQQASLPSPACLPSLSQSVVGAVQSLPAHPPLPHTGAVPQVYNLTPYLRFHPGGVPLLLKVAGRDGTALFNKYHAWVNYEFLLAKCLVGLLAPPSAAGTAAGAAGATASGAADAAGAAAAGSAGAVQQDAAARAGEGSSEQQQPDGGEAGAGGKEAQDGSDGGSSSAAVQAQQHEVAGGTETDVGGGQLVANKL